MTRQDLIILIKEAKRQRDELILMKAYGKADRLKGQIRLLKKKLWIVKNP